MRRITLWLTATLAVLAMITYYQASLSGDGKHAAESRSGAPVAAGSDHSGKPGESK